METTIIRPLQFASSDLLEEAMNKCFATINEIVEENKKEKDFFKVTEKDDKHLALAYGNEPKKRLVKAELLPGDQISLSSLYVFLRRGLKKLRIPFQIKYHPNKTWEGVRLEIMEKVFYFHV